MFRHVLALALVLFAAGTVSAQPVRSFEQLDGRIKPGEQVRITDSSGSAVTGRLAELTAEAVVIDTGIGTRRFAGSTVRQIAIRHRSVRLGAALGAVAGAVAIGIPECNGDPHDECGDGIVTGALLGAGLGAVAGAFIPRMTTVYVAPGTQVFVSPVIGPRSIGVSARMRW